MPSLNTLRANQKEYKSRLQLVIEAHEIHVARRKHDAVELEDLKFYTSQELDKWILRMNSLHKDLHGFRYFLRVIRRDDFVDRVKMCEKDFLEITDNYNRQSQARIVSEGLAETDEFFIFLEELAVERLFPGTTRFHLRKPYIDSTVIPKSRLLRHVRSLLNQKTEVIEDGQPKSNYPPALTLSSLENLPLFFEGLQVLLSSERVEKSRSAEDGSDSQPVILVPESPREPVPAQYMAGS